MAGALAWVTVIITAGNVAVLRFTAPHPGNSDIRAMAVSTATALGSLAAVWGLQLMAREARWTRPALGLMVCALAAVGMQVMRGDPAGQPPAWEEGWATLLAAGRGPRMSFPPALLLLVTALGTGLLAVGPSRVPFVREAGFLAAMTAAGLTFLCVVSSAAGNPIFSRTEPLSLTPAAALAFFVFNLALVVSASPTRRMRRLLFGVYEAADLPPLLRNDRTAFGLLALAGAIAFAGMVAYLRVQTVQFRRQVDAEMRVTSDLKAGQVAQWRQERLNDARALASMPLLPRMIEALTNGRASAEERADLVRWLDTYAQIYGYRGAVLLDGNMTPLLTSSTGEPRPVPSLHAPPGPSRPDEVARELAPYADDAGHLRLDYAGLIRRGPGTPPIGAVLLQTEPETFLRPILQAWPYGKQSARIGLWHRQGDTLHLLCGHQPAASGQEAVVRAFSQTRDVSNRELLIARAAAGDAALQEGVDVLGIPVIGMGRLIPDSDWLLAVRVDSSEIYGPLRRGAWQVVALVALLSAGMGFVLTRMWRQRAQDLQRDRILAELAQKRTAARLGLVMQEARDIILILDENLRIIEANAQAVASYGWTREELTRMTVRDLRAPETLGDFAGIADAASSATGATFETVHRRRDGSVFPVEVSARRGEGPGQRQILSIIRDISERKRAEAQLRASEERHRLISENTSDIIWLSDLPSGTFTYVSPSVRLILGWEPGEVIGRRVGDFVRTAEALRTRLRGRIAAHDAGDLSQRHQRYELELFHRDGSLRLVENSSSILPDANGRAAMLLSVSRDITERKRAETELRASEERYRLLADHLPDSLVYQMRREPDGTMRFVYISAGVQRIHGLQPEEVMRDATLLYEVILEEDLPGFRQAEEESFARMQPFNVVVRFRHPAGRVSWANIRSNPRRTPDGAVVWDGIETDITAQKVLEAERERLASVVDGHTDAVYWITPDNRFAYANETACRATGYTKPELLGQPVGLLAPGTDARILDGIWQQLRAQRQLRLESRHRRKDGTTYPVEIVALYHRHGAEEFNCSFVRDITERQRLESEIRASEERYRLIAENTSDVIWLYDLHADGFSYVSAAARLVLGYAPEEMLGQDLTLTLPGELAIRVREVSQQLRAEVQTAGQARHTVVEVDQRHKDGRFIPTEVTASILPGADGHPRHVLGITRDITERKRAHEALVRFSEELEGRVVLRTAELETRNREIQALLDSIPDTVLLCDPDGSVLFCHLPPPEARPAPVARAFAGPGAPAQDPVLQHLIARMIAAAQAAPGTVRQDFDLPGGPDEVVTVEARATAIGSHRVLLLLADITARKRLERSTLANLERERQLSAMKSQFVSVASHEFRTPLAAAIGSLELLDKHLPRLTDEKRRELIGRSRQSLNRLTAIIGDVLNLSRADSGRITVKRMTTDLDRFVQDIIREIELGDTGKHRISYEMVGAQKSVPADTNLLHHILSNLLGNAIRYSPAGSPVAVTLVTGAAEFSVTVADRGIGVAADDRERIFEPFARGSNVGQIGGTGLGLNIVRRYAELMGGRVELLDTAEGAAFRVTVPLEPTSP